MVSSFLLAVLGLAPLPKAPPVKAFVLAGQSNMVGHGFVMADPKRNAGMGSLEQVARNPATSRKFKHLLNKDGILLVRDDGAQDSHWNSSGETYYLIGDAMGRAMADLLKRGKR